MLTTWRPEPSPADPAKAMKQCPRTPLVTVDMASGQASNVFTRTDPEVKIRLQNWKPGVLSGRLHLPAAGRRRGGRPVRAADRRGELDRPQRAAQDPTVRTLYARARLTLSDGTQRAEQMVVARPRPTGT